jgi:NACalpha-BTF3-like transcription factor
MSRTSDLSAVTSYLETITSGNDSLPLRKAKSVIKQTPGPTKPKTYPKGAFTKEDLKLLMQEFEIEKALAESILFESNGDIQAAIQKCLKI